MRAVVECVAEDGIEGATMRRVAERAGVSTGMVTYYFRNKEDLIDATIAAAARELGERVEAMVGHDYGIERLDKAAELVLVDPEESGFPPIGFWMAFWSAATHKPHLRERFVQALSHNSESYRRSIDSAAAASGGAVDAELAAQLLSALVRGLRIDSGLAPESLSPERAVEVYRYCLLMLFGERPSKRQGAEPAQGQTRAVSSAPATAPARRRTYARRKPAQR